jgi:leucyl-tRNA synthetase
MVLLASVALHIAEELWEQTGHPGSVHQQVWPAWDSVLARDERLQVPVQVDGKVRQMIELSPNATQEEVTELAFSQSKVQDHLKGRQILRIHYIPGKILSVVTRLTSRES